MDGYKKELHVFNLRRVNTMSLLIFTAAFVCGTAINLFCTDSPYLFTGAVWLDAVVSVILLACGVILHEGIHALGAIVFGRIKPKNIRFGIKLREGLFYCHMKEPLTVSAYRITLILPVIITGLAPWAISVAFGNIFLIAVFSMLTAGGAGDIRMFAGLRKTGGKRLIIDHPNTVAYYLLYKKDELPENFVEATPENERETFERMSVAESEHEQKSMMLKTVAIAFFILCVAVGLYFLARLMQFI